MAETFTHACIKCGTSYTDTDPDPYYCSPCNEVRKVIAKQVDAKLAGITSKKTYSALQEYERLVKQRGTRFPKASDLGITF